MNSLILPLIVLAVIVLLVAAFASTKRQVPLIAKPLMTKRERECIVLLESMFPNHRIHAQVAMNALVRTKAGLDKKQNVSWRNKFDRKVVDFVMEERGSGDISALVELDDRTHNLEKDRKRDLMTQAAGYRTVRIPPRTKLTEQALRPIFAEVAPTGNVAARKDHFGRRLQTAG